MRTVLISANTDDINNEECLIVTIRDKTDRKRAEHAEKELTHVSRLALAGRVTSLVAHEVKQPLGAILSNAQAAEVLLKAETPDIPELRQIILEIQENEIRADSAIRRISLLLRKAEMKLQPLDMAELVSDIIRLTVPYALKRSVTVEFLKPRALPTGIGDPEHLQQVLLNLLLNEMDAAEEQAERERSIAISAREAGGEIMVSISPRWSANREATATGDAASRPAPANADGVLGLAIARTIIDAHNGRIWAEHDEDGRSTVNFTIASAKNSEGA